MAVIQYGKKSMFGGPDPSHPIIFEGFPKGAKLRLRCRPDEFARVFVRHAESGLMQEWYVSYENGIIRPSILAASNTPTEQKGTPSPTKRQRVIDPA